MATSSSHYSLASSQGGVLVGSYNFGGTAADHAVLGPKRMDNPKFSIDGLNKVVVDGMYEVLGMMQDFVLGWGSFYDIYVLPSFPRGELIYKLGVWMLANFLGPQKKVSVGARKLTWCFSCLYRRPWCLGAWGCRTGGRKVVCLNLEVVP